MSGSILVVGSINVDLVAHVDRLPRPGETVASSKLATHPGGKGANQANAAASLGGRVSMFGCVGDDANGAASVESLRASGVDTRFIRASPAAPTGTALIVVERGGQNTIVVTAGANATLGPAEVVAAIEEVRPSVLLLQLETPLDVVATAAATGRENGAVVVLDPAPACPLPANLLGAVDILTPNESEARLLQRWITGATFDGEPAALARALRGSGPAAVILTLGSDGAVVADERGERHHPAPGVEAIDATAAGDTFNGALAVALSEGARLDEAVTFANVAAALSVTRRGAQPSAPRRAEVDEARSAMPSGTRARPAAEQ